MSYRNPQGNVDRQSGQYIRQAQKDIAGATAGFAKAYAVKQQEIKKKIKEAEALSLRQDEWEMSMREKIATAEGEIKGSSPYMSLQMRDQINAKLDEVSKYIGLTNLSEEQKQEIVNMKTLPSVIKQFGVNSATYTENIRTQLKNQGSFGGIDPSYSSELTETFLGLSGNSSVEGETFYKMDLSGTEGPVVMIGFKKKGQDETRWVNSNQLNSLSDSGQTSAVAIIRDASSDMKAMVNNALMGNAEGKGNIKAEYWQGQKAKKIGDVTAGGKVTGERQSLTINKELLKQNIMDEALADVNNTSVTNRDKVGWFNKFQTELKGDKAVLLDHGDLVTDEQIQELAGLYADYAIEYYSPPSANVVSVARVSDSSGTKSSKSQAENNESANKLANDIYNAAEQRNSNYFVGKSYKGKEITGAEFTSDGKLEIVYTTGRTVKEEVKNDEGKMVEERKSETMKAVVDTKNPDSMGNLFNRFAIGEYGTDAGGEKIRDIGNPIIRGLVDKREGRNRFASGFSGR